MPQTPDPTIVALTGQLPFILIVAAVLALPISWMLLRIYRRAVLRSMKQRATPRAEERKPSSSPAVSQPPTNPTLEFVVLNDTTSRDLDPAAVHLHERMVRAPWQAASIYVLAGSCYGAIMAGVFLLASETEFLPLRFLELLLVYAWPVVPTITIVAASTRRAKVLVWLLYFFVLIILSSVSIAKSPDLTWGQVLTLWLVTNLLPTVLFLAFLNRTVRAVGPLVFVFLVLAFAGSNIVVSLAGSSDRLLRSLVEVGSIAGLGGTGLFFVLAVIGFAVFGSGGWLALRWIRRRYEEKKSSDQSITVDAVWLLFGVVHSISMAFEGALWILGGVVAFTVYKVMTSVAFQVLNKSHPTGNGTTLLLLRVFALGKRSERLFDAVTLYWRYAGSVNLIAGPDLATTTVEPHEFLDFLSGRLSRRFIDRPETLDQRASEMDIAADRDRRFRVNDFFCHDDTWKMVLSHLVGESNAVLMDLRGFSPRNAGCIYEIETLMKLVQIGKVVFLVDGTTDELFLKDVMSRSRGGAADANRILRPARVFLFRFIGSRPGELRALLRDVCAAAG